MAKPTTGKHTVKEYKCTSCGAVEKHGTNHWGEIYPKCRSCGWRHPMNLGGRFVCLENCPDTHDLPTPWKTVKLGDIIDTTKLRKRANLLR